MARISIQSKSTQTLIKWTSHLYILYLEPRKQSQLESSEKIWVNWIVNMGRFAHHTSTYSPIMMWQSVRYFSCYDFGRICALCLTVFSVKHTVIYIYSWNREKSVDLVEIFCSKTFNEIPCVNCMSHRIEEFYWDVFYSIRMLYAISIYSIFLFVHFSSFVFRSHCSAPLWRSANFSFLPTSSSTNAPYI